MIASGTIQSVRIGQPTQLRDGGIQSRTQFLQGNHLIIDDRHDAVGRNRFGPNRRLGCRASTVGHGKQDKESA